MNILGALIALLSVALIVFTVLVIVSVKRDQDGKPENIGIAIVGLLSAFVAGGSFLALLILGIAEIFHQ